MSPCDLPLEIAKFIAQAAVIVLGWVVVHRLSRERDRTDAHRRLVLDEVSNTLELLNGVFDRSVTYHLNQRSIADERRLKLDIKDLVEGVERLTRSMSSVTMSGKLRRVAIDFKKACTLDHFEDEHVSPLLEEADQIQNIGRSFVALRATLKDIKFEMVKLN